MKFLKHFAFTVYNDFVRRRGTAKAWKQIEESQWWSTEQLVKYQHEKLVKLFHHAYSNVLYYRNIFRKAKMLESDLGDPIILNRLPLLEKSIIRDNYQNLCAGNIGRYETKQSSTSGSTGESLFFLVGESNGAFRKMSTFRNFGWCNVSPFDHQALLWGARFDEPTRKSFGDRLRLWARPVLFLSSYDLSEAMMADYIKQLQDFRPKLFVSYPSPMEHFAEYCIDQDLRIPSLKAVICSAEQLVEHQREIIEKAFDVAVFNRYGCREFADVAQECDEHNGLHVNAERVYVEIIDENGEPCPLGKLGELVITDLDNYAMPFIRYRIGDMAAWSERDCPCGRGLPLLDRVEGRAFDLIKTRSGRYLSGTFWTLLLRHISQHIVALQVRQENIAGVEILLKMLSGQLSHESEQLLRRKIAEKAPDLEVHIKYVDHIPLTKSGKRRFVISNIA